MSGVSDLIVFLLAQLALDEARAASGPGAKYGAWDTEPYRDGTGENADLRARHLGNLTGPAPGSIDAPAAEHAARHDPARVLREVAAKRAILAEHGPANGGRDPDRCRVCTAIAPTGMGHTDARRFRAPCPTLLFLAAVYSDHPDYRQEWKP